MDSLFNHLKSNQSLSREICRTCLKVSFENEQLLKLTSEDMTYPSISYLRKLQDCVPEMVVETGGHSALCPSCTIALNSAYSFKRMCLQTEERLKTFNGTNSSNVNYEVAKKDQEINVDKCALNNASTATADIKHESTKSTNDPSTTANEAVNIKCEFPVSTDNMLTEELQIKSEFNGSIPKSYEKRNVSKCRKCICMPQRIGPVEFPTIWTEFRINNQLCDGIVKSEDGCEFKVHRAILSAVSPYFKALFTNSINRGQPETREANIDVPSVILQKLLDFAYTGNFDINIENVELLLRFSDQYDVMGVVQLCCQFILDQLQPSNCLGILRFARHYFSKDLERRGRLYVRHNFPRLLKEGNEFETLDIQDVIDILEDDELNVKSEEAVFEAIQRWVETDPENRNPHLLQLLKCIRLGRLSYDYITNIMNWDPVLVNEPCQNYLMPVISFIENSSNDVIDIISRNLLRPRIPHDILFAVGGWSAGSPTNFIETYDTRADRWLRSMDTDSVPRASHGLCTINGLIYMIGGFDGNEHFNTVRCFDPLKHTWKECACMYYPRCFVSVVMHQNKIYALGGYNGRVRMNSAERYDPEFNQWELIPPMQRQRSAASAAALHDKVYIVGGFNGQEVMSSAEVFDTVTSQWSFIPHMFSARSGVSLIAFKNTLYALGGFNGFRRLTSGEKYIPGQCGDWLDIAEMFSPRSNFATVILDDLIFVIGGYNGSTAINYVECYDVENNEWFDAAPMNLNRSSLSACVVSGLPNSREYSLVGSGMHEDEVAYRIYLINFL